MDAKLLEETLRVGHALRSGVSPRLKKARRRQRIAPIAPIASAQKLRESGLFSERDIQILSEGHEREVAFVNGAERPARSRAQLPADVDTALQEFQEAVESTATTSAAAIPTDWTEASTGTLTHPVHGSIHMNAGRFVHRDRNGVIRGSGNAAMMDGYVKKLKVTGDQGGNPAASGAADANSESLDSVLNRIRGIRPSVDLPAGTHQKLAEALTRTARSAPSTVDGDLHARLKAAVTR